MFYSFYVNEPLENWVPSQSMYVILHACNSTPNKLGARPTVLQWNARNNPLKIPFLSLLKTSDKSPHCHDHVYLTQKTIRGNNTLDQIMTNMSSLFQDVQLLPPLYAVQITDEFY